MEVVITLKVNEDDQNNQALRDLFTRCGQEVLDVSEFAHNVTQAIGAASDQQQ